MTNNLKSTVSAETLAEIVKISDIFVGNNQTSHILDKLLNAIRLGKAKKNAGLISLTGNSGTGKTTFINQFQNKNPSVKIKIFELDSKETIETLVQAILLEIGDPLSNNLPRSIDDMSRQTETQIRAKAKAGQLDLIIFDEAHHLHAGKSNTTAKNVREWAKQAPSSWGIPVMFVGLSDIEEMFLKDRQLRRRRLATLQLKEFRWDNVQDQLDWRTFLKVVDDALPFPESSKLSNKKQAQAIFEATSGVFGFAEQLLISAAERAALQGHSSIKRADFHNAFEDHRDDFECDGPNPFYVAEMSEAA